VRSGSAALTLDLEFSKDNRTITSTTSLLRLKDPVSGESYYFSCAMKIMKHKSESHPEPFDNPSTCSGQGSG
jgi:hypothetical protein